MITDRWTVTGLIALITVCVTGYKAYDEHLKNEREANRLLSEQHDKIRQANLDRVLKSGITDLERLRIFNLLVKFKSDPELQSWAEEERKKAQTDYEKAVTEKENALKEVSKKQDEIDELKQQARVSGSQQNELKKKIGELETLKYREKQRADNLGVQIGDSISPSPYRSSASVTRDFQFLDIIEPINLRFVDTNDDPIPSMSFSIGGTSYKTDATGYATVQISKTFPQSIILNDLNYSIINPSNGSIPSAWVFNGSSISLGGSRIRFVNTVVCKRI